MSCCERLIRYRSGECLPKNLKVAKRFLIGLATKKEMHKAEWEIEGQAFGTEYYSEKGIRFYFRADKNVKSDLLKVRISEGLGNAEARRYLINMAYFIDSAFCYIQFTGNWFIKDNYENFLCPRLFERYFGKDA